MSRRLQALQVESEIKQLLGILQAKKINRMLEIGTYHGGTLFLFSRVLPNNSIMYSLDMPRGKFGGGCPDWWVSVIKHIPQDNQEIHFIRADSHNPKTKSELQEMLKGQELDFLFIDGDHTYEGVKRDFEMYSPLVGKQGIIAFHDIVEHPPETGCDVNKFWQEVKKRFRYQEIVEDYSQKWAGIGILFL